MLTLLDEHLTEMRRVSPPESVHALDPGALAHPSITFWTLRQGVALLGCAALKELSATDGEVKSMRTSATARGRGVATALLGQVLDEARRRGYRRLSLETGAEDFFAPARRLYERHGFMPCAPFADYPRDDPNSVFLTREL